MSQRAILLGFAGGWYERANIISYATFKRNSRRRKTSWPRAERFVSAATILCLEDQPPFPVLKRDLRLVYIGRLQSLSYELRSAVAASGEQRHKASTLKQETQQLRSQSRRLRGDLGSLVHQATAKAERLSANLVGFIRVPFSPSWWVSACARCRRVVAIGPEASVATGEHAHQCRKPSPPQTNAA